VKGVTGVPLNIPLDFSFVWTDGAAARLLYPFFLSCRAEKLCANKTLSLFSFPPICIRLFLFLFHLSAEGGKQSRRVEWVAFGE
jgi:hypothetical protein